MLASWMISLSLLVSSKKERTNLSMKKISKSCKQTFNMSSHGLKSFVLGLSEDMNFLGYLCSSGMRKVYEILEVIFRKHNFSVVEIVVIMKLTNSNHKHCTSVSIKDGETSIKLVLERLDQL